MSALFGIPWTEAEIAFVRQRRDEGVYLKDIASQMPGRTLKAISAMVQREALPRRPRGFKKRPTPPRSIRQSAKLRDAIIGAIAQYANDNEIDIDSAARFLISGQLIAGDKIAAKA